jgi:hypothetical protein
VTSTLSMPRVITADEQASATTKAGPTTGGSESLPFNIWIADLDPTVSTATEQNRSETVRPVLSVEARIRLSAQDEEYDVSLIRDEDLLP